MYSLDVIVFAFVVRSSQRIAKESVKRLDTSAIVVIRCPVSTKTHTVRSSSFVVRFDFR